MKRCCCGYLSEHGSNFKRHQKTCLQHNIRYLNEIIQAQQVRITHLENAQKSRKSVLREYGYEDLSDIDSDFFKTITSMPCTAISVLQRKLLQKPENRNVIIKNVQNKIIYVFNGSGFVPEKRQEFLSQHIFNLCELINIRAPETPAWADYQDKLLGDPLMIKSLIEDLSVHYMQILYIG